MARFKIDFFSTYKECEHNFNGGGTERFCQILKC